MKPTKSQLWCITLYKIVFFSKIFFGFKEYLLHNSTNPPFEIWIPSISWHEIDRHTFCYSAFLLIHQARKKFPIFALQAQFLSCETIVHCKYLRTTEGMLWRQTIDQTIYISSIAKSRIGFWNYFFESWPLPLKENFVFSFQCYCITTERAIHFTKLQSFCHQTMPPAALRYKQCNDWKPVHAFVALQPPPY